MAIPLSGIFYSLGNVAIVQYLIILTGFIAFALISLGLMVSASRSVSLLSSAADSIGHGDVKVLPQFHHGHYFYPLAKSIRENAERVESYIQTITEQKFQLESILDGIEEGILLLNSAGRIDSSNRAARSMFSSIPELKGRRPLEVIRSPELQAACNRILENEIHSFHSEVAFGVGSVLPCSYSPHRAVEGPIRGDHSPPRYLGVEKARNSTARFCRQCLP